MLYIKWVLQMCAQWMAARPLLQAAVARLIARTRAADSSRCGEVMTVAAQWPLFLSYKFWCACHPVPVPLWLAGKRAGRLWLGQLTAIGELIFLKEEGTGRPYLVDTGTAVSVVPFRGRSATATAYLTGPYNTVILAWGSVRLQLCFGS
jgi:hypothetical protein